MDRYAYSGIAYSLAKENPEITIDWCKPMDRGLPAPDLVIFLNISVEEAKKRAEYGKERYEKEEFQRKVAQNFQLLRESNWFVLDATLSPETLHQQIADKILSTISTFDEAPISSLWE